VDLFLDPQFQVAKIKEPNKVAHAKEASVAEKDVQDASCIPDLHAGAGSHDMPTHAIESPARPDSSKRFSCFLACPGKKTASSLYHHYSFIHFREQIFKRFGNQDMKCRLCEKQCTSEEMFLFHVGVLHRQVDIFLKPQFCLPKHVLKAQAASVKQKDGLKFWGAGLKVPSTTAQAKRYSCSFCIKKTGSPNALYSHYSTVHFVKQIGERFVGRVSGQCPICSKCFKSELNFLSHQGIVHGLVEAFLEPRFHVRMPINEKRKKRVKKSVKAPIRSTGESGLMVESCSLCPKTYKGLDGF